MGYSGVGWRAESDETAPFICLSSLAYKMVWRQFRGRTYAPYS
jgi:hypothetical protein